jgi:hypothetical protein
VTSEQAKVVLVFDNVTYDNVASERATVVFVCDDVTFEQLTAVLV